MTPAFIAAEFRSVPRRYEGNPFDLMIPHYFKYVVTDINESTQPRVEHARGISGDGPECVVNIPSCTGDYLGSWDGFAPKSV